MPPTHRSPHSAAVWGSTNKKQDAHICFYCNLYFSRFLLFIFFRSFLFFPSSCSFPKAQVTATGQPLLEEARLADSPLRSGATLTALLRRRPPPGHWPHAFAMVAKQRRAGQDEVVASFSFFWGGEDLAVVVLLVTCARWNCFFVSCLLFWAYVGYKTLIKEITLLLPCLVPTSKAPFSSLFWSLTLTIQSFTRCRCNVFVGHPCESTVRRLPD